MRIGVELAVKATITQVLDDLKTFDSHGFDRVWVPDSQISMWEMWTTAALAASHTQRARIGVGVTAPYHRSPVVIAHAAMTLDQLSDGRIDLSLGRGHRRFLQSIGVDGEDAGVEEAIAILRGLMSGEAVSYEGSEFKFTDVSLRVKSHQERIAIYIASTSDRWMEVAAKCSDGIHTYTSNPHLINRVKKWSGTSGREDFSVVTTLGFVEPREVREWWVTNFGNNYNLQLLCGREPGTGTYEELAEELVFTDSRTLRSQLDKLERMGVDELMIAYRRPEDLTAISEMVKSVL